MKATRQGTESQQDVMVPVYQLQQWLWGSWNWQPSLGSSVTFVWEGIMLSLEEFRNGDEMVIRLFYDRGKNSYIDRIRTELIGHELGSRDLYYKSCHKLLVHGNIISDESCTACLVTVFMCDSQRHIFLEHLWMSLMFIDWTSSEAMIYKNE